MEERSVGKMSVSAEESAVKVSVRVRPLIEREERATAEDSVPVPLYWKADRKSIHQLDDGVTTKSFSYDRVFSSSETTNHLYQDIAKPLVVSAVEGYNGTIFAYGQTSSGKTFTMMGSKLVPGVIPLSMEEVFQAIQNYPQKEFLLRVSYMEIYNETVTDLLVDNWKRKPLEVREALNKNIYVADLTEELVTCPAQALSWVFKGEKNRNYGKTKMNERSSRSHTIFRMILESREKSDPASGDNSEGAIIVSHLNLVDLAGSERASQTGAEGARFKEGCNINRSLFTLAQVIKKLSDESQRGFTNYRDSKLTRILQNSLGGNAKTVIICTITMAALEETLSTLQFASTAKKMKNDPHVTEVSDDGALLKRYRNEIVDLKRRLQEVSSVTHVTHETLSQLLQEKDQLQKEHQDRIKNLTKLLVTGSSLMTAKKEEEVLAKLSPLEEERSGGEEVLAKLSPLEEERSGGEEVLSRAASLQQQVELLAREKREAWEEVERLEQRALELEVQRSAQAQEQQEQVQMLELRLTDLQEQSHTEAGPDEQMKKEFEETIRMCETLVSEKELVFAERDYLRQEMELLLGQVSSLAEEKGSLAQELQELQELEEFKALEDDCSDDEKRVLQNEIVSLKSNVESWERKCRDLESQLGSMSGQLAKKSSWAQELESMQGKDLLQEVSELRRSLDDAEVLCRDTRKEWAVLRSQNLSLKDRDVELSSSHQQMVVEVGGLRSQLEKEKSRFKSMQTDLQKELTMAFKENTKLTALLDGKVPSPLREGLNTAQEAESALREELKTAQEAESALREELNMAQEAESALREELSCSEQQCSLLQGQLRGLLEEQEVVDRLEEDKTGLREVVTRRAEEDTTRRLKALRRELEGLEEAQRRSGERLTINKRTTQLLQTELQDACAKIHDKETAISTLRGKLRLSEEAQVQMQAPPSVLELEELRGKVLKMEVEVTSATTKHQKEVKSLSSLLNIKEESLRKLRETLRKSQKEQQESFLQGEDLYCRLTHPEGSKVQTSGSLERSKLEEEIRLLQLKVAELQSLLSSQKAEISGHQAEISKWRSRALTLKEKANAMRPHLAAPTTPSKKRLFPDANATATAAAAASDSALFCSSPKRVLEAPANVPDPNQTYGVDSTEFLRSTLARPKQFFDNSALGINPGSSSAVEQKEEMWPMSPKKEEMCTSQ